MDNKKILEVSNITKSYPGVLALDNISFILYEKEVHCLVGENGAGKSTLIKILSGAIRPDEGKINVYDKGYNFLDPHLSKNLGISTIYQERNLIETLSIAENIFFGEEKINKFGFLDYKKTFNEAQNILDLLNVKINAKRFVCELSISEKQIVKIAKALSKSTKILIMDEPTTSLNQNEIEGLLEIVLKIRNRGMGIIYISHRIKEVFDIADRITVLRDGREINTHYIKEVDEQRLISEMVGRKVDKFYSREKVNIGASILSIKDYRLKKGLKTISFELREGEILGIAGMVGSGRSELVKGICSLGKIEKGLLKVREKTFNFSYSGDAIKAGLCLVPEDRQLEGLVLCRSIRENTTISALNRFKGLFIKLGFEKKEVTDIVSKVNLKYSSIEQLTQNLSGGNQQKVVLAKWLFANSDIFIFDEPTRGIDVGAKQEIYKLMIEIIKNKKGIIMISSDMPELISMSDRVIVLRNGEISGILEKEQIEEKNILKLAIGVNR